MGTIDLDLLPVFVAVGETSSFSAAAVKLGIPKSSVSRSISRLEQATGVRLLHRTTRKVALSTAGAALYERVSPQLSALVRSLGDLPELEEQPSGQVRVTAAVDFGSSVLADIIARFVARYPAVEIDLRLSNDFVDIVAEGFDVAFRIAMRPLRDSSLMAQKAGAIAMQLFASPSYLALRGAPRSPRDLERHTWVVYRSKRAVRMEGPSGAATVVPQGRVVSDDMSCSRELVRAGAGIGLLPTFTTDADVAAGHLVRVLPRWAVRTGHLYLVCPGSRHLPRKVTAFRDFVLEALRTRPLAPSVGLP